MPNPDSRPPARATSTDIKYLTREIDSLKEGKADKGYVKATDKSLQELVQAKLGDVDQMKKFIILALVAIAFVVTGVGGTYIVRFTNLTNSVEAHTRVIRENGTTVGIVSARITKHETAQEIQRVQDSVALDGKLGTMEQRIVTAVAQSTKGEKLEPLSEEEYITRRKAQLTRELRRLEKSRSVTLSPSLKRSLSKSLDDERRQIEGDALRPVD